MSFEEMPRRDLERNNESRVEAPLYIVFSIGLNFFSTGIIRSISDGEPNFGKLLTRTTLPREHVSTKLYDMTSSMFLASIRARSDSSFGILPA